MQMRSLHFDLALGLGKQTVDAQGKSFPFFPYDVTGGAYANCGFSQFLPEGLTGRAPLSLGID